MNTATDKADFDSIIAATMKGDSPNSGNVALDNAALSITVMARAYGDTADDMTAALRSWAEKNLK